MKRRGFFMALLSLLPVSLFAQDQAWERWGRERMRREMLRRRFAPGYQHPHYLLVKQDRLGWFNNSRWVIPEFPYEYHPRYDHLHPQRGYLPRSRKSPAMTWWESWVKRRSTQR